MSDGIAKPGTGKTDLEKEWDRSERRSSRIALAIALIPIPIAVAISWSMGSPPWEARPVPGVEDPAGPTSSAREWPGSGHDFH